MATAFPFSAIVGQDEMKLALLIAAVDPKVGGVLAFGDRGSGKSTAVRALAALLPKMKVVAGCRYNCDPDRPARILRRVPGPRGQGRTEIRASAGAGRRPAARRDRGPRRRRARSGTGVGARREGIRAGIAGARASRIPLHRRSQSAGGSSGRSPARCRRVRRKRRRARRPEHPPSGAVRAGRHRQSRGGRVASATARSLRHVGRGEDAERPSQPHRGRAPPRRIRKRHRRVHRDMGQGRDEAAQEDHVGSRTLAVGHRIGRDAGACRQALHGARHRRPARGTDADARRARAGRARRRKDRQRRAFAPRRAVGVAPSPAPQSARRCRFQRAGRPRHRGSLRDDGRARLVRCGDRGAVVRGRSGRHRRRSGPVACGPGARALDGDAARGVADLASR